VNPNKFAMSTLKITWDVDCDVIVDPNNLIAKELDYSLNDKKECSPGMIIVTRLISTSLRCGFFYNSLGVVLRTGKKTLYMWNSAKDSKKSCMLLPALLFCSHG
jgi:hypothetical protein